MLYLDLGVVLTTGNVFLYIVYRIFLEAKKEQAMYIFGTTYIHSSIVCGKMFQGSKRTITR